MKRKVDNTDLYQQQREINHQMIKKRLDPEYLPYNWIDILFIDHPNWDEDGKAPLEIYAFYHTVNLLPTKTVYHSVTDLGKDGVYQYFMVHKAISFNLMTPDEGTEFLAKLPSELTVSNFNQILSLVEEYFSREALMAIGI